MNHIDRRSRRALKNLSTACIESLETRRLCSVTAATLAGPLTIGSTWNYQQTDTTGDALPTITTVIRAPVTGSYDSLDVESTLAGNASDGTVATVKSAFEELDSRQGLIEKGTSSYYSPGAYNPVDDYSPSEVIFPSVMVAGTTYASRYADRQTEYGQSTRAIVKDTTTLESETPVPITVPAGTFDAYEVIDSLAGTKWIAPGVGLIEQITPSATATTTQVLISYQIAGDPSKGQIAPQIVSSSLPGNLNTGSSVHDHVGVQIKNLGLAPEDGPVSTEIFAALTDDGVIDSTSYLLGSTAHSYALNPGSSAHVNVPIRAIPAGLYDQYYLVARSTDHAGNIITQASSYQAYIAPMHGTVTAAVLAGPLTIGTTWNYSDGSSVSIDGADTDGDVAGNYLAVTNTSAPEEFINDRSIYSEYEALTSHHGLLGYGSYWFDPEGLLQITYANHTPETLFPAVMVPGRTYHSRFVSTAISTDAGGNVPSDNTVMLVSDELKPITVPAGTFGAYEIIRDGESIEWIAPGVGIIENGGAQLTSYNIPGGTSEPQLAAAIISSSLASNLVSGSKSHASVRVQLANLGKATYTGAVTTILNLESYETVQLATVTTQVSLEPGGFVSLRIPISHIPADADEDYALTAETNYAQGLSTSTTGAVEYTIGPPAANLFVTASADAPHLTAGSGTCFINIENDGNIDSAGSGEIELLVTPNYNASTPLLGATSILTQTIKLNVAPGENRNYVIHLPRALVDEIALNSSLLVNLIAPGAEDPAEIDAPLYSSLI